MAWTRLKPHAASLAYFGRGAPYAATNGVKMAIL
jgi:hypothetical protein